MKNIKKRAQALLGLVLLPCLILCLCACGEKEPYELWQPDDQIESIEIVDVHEAINDPSGYDVILTVENQKSFLEKFYEIPFDTFLFGDPTTAYGPCLRIEYKNGDCEFIDDHGQNRFLNGAPNNRYYGRRYCDQEEFLALLTYFGYVG